MNPHCPPKAVSCKRQQAKCTYLSFNGSKVNSLGRWLRLGAHPRTLGLRPRTLDVATIFYTDSLQCSPCAASGAGVPRIKELLLLLLKAFPKGLIHSTTVQLESDWPLNWFRFEQQKQIALCETKTASKLPPDSHVKEIVGQLSIAYGQKPKGLISLRWNVGMCVISTNVPTSLDSLLQHRPPNQAPMPAVA